MEKSLYIIIAPEYSLNTFGWCQNPFVSNDRSTAAMLPIIPDGDLVRKLRLFRCVLLFLKYQKVKDTRKDSKEGGRKQIQKHMAQKQYLINNK